MFYKVFTFELRGARSNHVNFLDFPEDLNNKIKDAILWGNTNKRTDADPEILERGGPEAIICKFLERGGPKSLIKMAFECSSQSFSFKSFANNYSIKKGAWAPPLNLPLKKNHLVKINLFPFL